jgi:hypothetical protein
MKNQSLTVQQCKERKMTVIVEPAEYESLPMGEYAAEITDIVEIEGNYDKPVVQFTYTLLGEEHKDRTIRGWCNKTMNRKSNLYKLTKAILNRSSLNGYTFNSDDLIGRRVLLTVLVKPREDGTPSNRIESVRSFLSNETGGSATPPPSRVDDIPF